MAQHSFRSNRITHDDIDELKNLGGYETKAEFFRALVRDYAQRKQYDLHSTEE